MTGTMQIRRRRCLMRGGLAGLALTTAATMTVNHGRTDTAPQAIEAAAGADPLNEAATASARATRITAAPPSTTPGPPPTTGPDTPVGGSSSAGWIVGCPYSHTLTDDPIVHPGMPGMSHSHDFLGATDTNAYSTIESMRAGETTCGIREDTAGYWVPTLYQGGTAVHPITGARSHTGEDAAQNVYYRNPNGVVVHPIPAGLRMVVGNSKAKSLAENPLLGREIWFGCGDNSVSGKPTSPPSSCGEGIITLHVHFPNCWDGVNLDSADHISHVAWSTSDRCPRSHPVTIPQITIRLEYVVGPTTGDITFASGETFTIHGDFWNTWDQGKLDRMTADCINAGKDCGKFR